MKIRFSKFYHGSILTNKSRVVYNGDEIEYPHPVLPRLWRRELIGNQVQVLSDPVTVSEESAANAIAKARRRGGQGGASQETCWIRRGWVSSAERGLSGARPLLESGGQVFWRVWDLLSGSRSFFAVIYKNV